MSSPVPDIYNKLKRFAAVLGLIQGLTWFILSVICIAYYHQELIDIDFSSYMDIVELSMYLLYLASDVQIFTDQVVTGGVFDAFAFIYMFLSLSWIFLSILMWRRNQQIVAWSYLTFVISIWDLIVVFIFAADYSKCLSFAEDLGIFGGVEVQIGFQAVCANGVLIPLIIIGRGFILWVINICLAVSLYRIGKVQKGEVFSS